MFITCLLNDDMVNVQQGIMLRLQFVFVGSNLAGSQPFQNVEHLPSERENGIFRNNLTAVIDI